MAGPAIASADLSRQLGSWVPAPVRAITATLREGGSEAWIVGEALAERLANPVAPPADGSSGGSPTAAFEVATNASLDELLAAFPRAVVISPSQLLLPTAAGPVDLSMIPPGGTEPWLARRDFRIHAIAWDPQSDRWLDPCEGLADAAAGRLTCPGDPRMQLMARPVRALRAARLVAERGFELDPTLRDAMAYCAERWRTPTPLFARRELVRLLLAPGAGAAITLLRDTGLEAAVAPGVAENAAQRIDALPKDLWLRLAAWLPRKTASRFMRIYRFGHAAAKRVLRILDHHPIEQQADPKRETSVRRLLQRLTVDEREALFVLREAELTLAPEAEALRTNDELRVLREAISSIQAQDARRNLRGSLALDGERAMEIVGCGPGPLVGRALRYLGARVDAGEIPNEQEALEAALRAWLASSVE